MPSDFNIVLHEPQIPQNTGSIARLCACTGAILHLVHPLGFSVDATSVKRAGLDYWPHVDIRNHDNWDAFLDAEKPGELHFFSKLATRSYFGVPFLKPVYFVFGGEVKGLPRGLWERYPERFLKIPMRTHLVRSLNLAQCAALILYEGLRQEGFDG